MAHINRWAGIIFIVLVACAPSPGTPLDGGPPATIRVGYFPNITHSQALIGIANGAFQQSFGARARIDPKIFNAGPSEIEALFAGEIDLGYIGPNPAINGYVKSKGEALRIIAGATSAGAELVVRTDANISSAADLAGKRIATPELGNTQDVAARYYISANGLKLREKGGNVTILPAKNADILTLFLKKEIDAAWVPEPWGARLVREAGGRVLVDERSLWPEGKFVTAHLIVSTRFLKSNPDLVKQWLAVHVDVTQWIRANPVAAKKIANKELERLTGKGLAAEVLDDAWQRMEVTYDPISASLLKSADNAFTLGFLGKDKPDLGEIYDLKLLNEVLMAKDLQAVR